MKKIVTVTRIAITVVIFMIGLIAWGQWQSPPDPAPASIALLLPDDLPEDSHFIRMWQDSAQEEGVRLQPVKISEW
jgi:hypothetical protein